MFSLYLLLTYLTPDSILFHLSISSFSSVFFFFSIIPFLLATSSTLVSYISFFSLPFSPSLVSFLRIPLTKLCNVCQFSSLFCSFFLSFFLWLFLYLVLCCVDIFSVSSSCCVFFVLSPCNSVM